MLPAALFAASQAIALAAYPAQELLAMGRPIKRYFDVQVRAGSILVERVLKRTNHRAGASRRSRKHGRKHLAQFCVVCGRPNAWALQPDLTRSSGRGLIDGATTLEMDNGITQVCPPPHTA